MAKKCWIYTLLVVLFILLSIGTYFGGKALYAYWNGRELTDEQEQEIIDKNKNEDGSLTIQDGERVNVLVMGIDARPGEEDSRTDTMMLASIDPKLKKIVVVSIPRDTRVNIAGHGEQKINAANVIGGVELAEKTVEDLLNVKIDYYVKVSFDGFAQIIDALGGVDVNVEQRMYHVGTTPDEDIDLYPGEQHLNGAQSLAYVRFRGYTTGDIGRTQHQQEFLHQLMKVVAQPSTILKIPTLIGIIRDNMKTDMPMTKMLQVASWAPLFTTDSIISQTLPGDFYDVRDGSGNLLNSFWEANKTVAKTLVNDLFNGKTYDVVSAGAGGTSVVQNSSSYDAEDEEGPYVPSETPEGGTDGDAAFDSNSDYNYTGTDSDNGTYAPVDDAQSSDPNSIDFDTSYLNGDNGDNGAADSGNDAAPADNSAAEAPASSDGTTYSDGYEDPFAGTVSSDVVEDNSGTQQ